MSPRPEAAPVASQLQAPRLATLWAAGVYVLATLSLAYPALGGAFLVSPHSDQYIAGYAFREFAAATLKAGEGFPQWNPYLFGGMPYISAMHGDIFYPTFLLRLLLPTDVAMTWGFVIHLFLAGFFTFCFLRAWGSGIGYYGALVGGLAYMLSGPIAGLASPGHDGKLFVSALLPLSLWMIVRLVRDGRAWAWAVFALTVGLAFLSPHPQLFQYFLLASGAFSLYVAFSEHGSGGRLSRRAAISRLGLLLGGVLLGVVIGAVQYLPSLIQYEKWSPRAGGAGYAHAVSYSMPLEELINTVIPQFSGILDSYWGRNSLHFHSEYAGVAVLVLAGAGMFSPLIKRGFRWFWIGTLAVSLLWALGGYTPFYQLIYHLVPYTKYLRAPSTMMFLSMLAVSVLAALGTDRVLSAAATLTKKFLVGWPVAVGLLGILIAASLSATVAENVGTDVARRIPNAPVGDVIAFKVQQAQENQPEALLGAARSFVVAVLAIGLILARARNRILPSAAAYLLATLVAIDLWSIERLYWIFSPRATTIFASDAAIERIRSDSVPGRVLAYAPRGTLSGRDRAFSGDLFMTHRLRSATGYHGNELGRYQQLLDASNGGLTPSFWRHENVRYFYTTLPDSGVPGLTKILGPIQNRAGSTVYLYRLPGNNPAALVATSMAKASDDEALATVLNAAYDPERFAIVDPEADVPAVTLSTLPPAAGVKASVSRYEPREINVQLDNPVASGMALVVSENYFPGWRASASGQNATVFRANYNLIGVVLPAGAREVQLRFSDPAYATGKIVTLIALAIAIAALLAGIVIDRRVATPQPVPAV